MNNTYQMLCLTMFFGLLRLILTNLRSIAPRKKVTRIVELHVIIY